MKVTRQQLIDGVTLTPKQKQLLICVIKEQLTQEKATEILQGAIDETNEEIEEYKNEHENYELIPLIKQLAVTSQAFLMGVRHGLNVYNDIVKSAIKEFEL